MQYQGLTLDPFQAEAIEAIEDGYSVLVAAPTGTGKTLTADYLIEMVIERGGSIVYTAPIKALSNQKYRQYCKMFGEDKVGLITGDIVIRRNAPIRIMTTEILRNVLLQGDTDLSQHVTDEAEQRSFEETVTASTARMEDVDDLSAVIIDEIHFVDDPDRGTVWEELLIYLPNHIQILGLSATLSNLEEFAQWLSEIRGKEVKVVREEQRAVPLSFHVANRDAGVVDPSAFNKAYAQWKKDQKSDDRRDGGRRSGRGRRGRKSGRGRDKRSGRRSRRSSSSTNHLEVIEKLGNDAFPALYFIYSRKLTEQLAHSLAKSEFGKSLGSRTPRHEIDPMLREFNRNHPGVISRDLRLTLQKGIAYHHAGLHVALKTLVEELYEKRLLNVLYCTSTFALGINMPARTVIFDAVTKFNGVEIVPLSVREFMQMAGRAGRRGIDKEGDVVVKLDFSEWGEHQGTFKHLMSGNSEPVRSSFNLSFNSVVNLLDRYDERTIRTLLERSFKAFQLGRRADGLEKSIDGTPAEKSRDARRKRAYLERELAEARRPLLWEQFQRKVSFLRAHGYVGANDELLAAGRVCQQIQFAEIFVTELFMAGVFEEMSGEEVFGVMTGLVQSLPRSAKVSKPGDDKWWAYFDQLGAVFESEVVWGAQELVGEETTFTPALMPLGEMWARGDSLREILDEVSNPTDLSGDLVGAFRRAKDLVGQLRNVVAEDELRRKELTAILRAVSRDEVEAID